MLRHNDGNDSRRMIFSLEGIASNELAKAHGYNQLSRSPSIMPAHHTKEICKGHLEDNQLALSRQLQEQQ